MALPTLNYVYAAEVLKIVDGDTIYLFIDRGFKDWFKANTRLARINAPEMNTEAGKTAKAFLESKVPLGSRVIIQSKKLDPYGRPIAEVWLGDVNLSNLMLESGNAVPYTGG